MNLEERLKFCSICTNRTIDRNIGLICKLDNKKPSFKDECPSFNSDKRELNRKLQVELNAAGDIKTTPDSSYKYIMYSGIITFLVGLTVFFILSIFWGIFIIVIGILMMIKSDKQKKILEQHQKFKKKHNL